MTEQEYINQISKYANNKLLFEYNDIITCKGNWEGYLTPSDCRMLTLMDAEMLKRKLKSIHLMTKKEYQKFEKTIK